MHIDQNAYAAWNKLDIQLKLKISNNVYCVVCKDITGIGNMNVRLEEHGLVLEGVCTKCSGPVTRLIETC